MRFLGQKQLLWQKTNPNKPNSNPIQTQYKPIFTTKNRPQTQSNPTCPCAGRDPVSVLKLAISPNPIKRPLQPWVQRGDRPKRNKQMCSKNYLLSYYTGAPTRQFVTLFLRFLEKKYKITIIWPKTHKKISPPLFNLLLCTDYLSFHPVAFTRRHGGVKILFRGNHYGPAYYYHSFHNTRHHSRSLHQKMQKG